ncbi:metallophosphoesterase family protein [Priestia megaterium]|uniref:metallophosphoesterase family protein n=1 Tax=Priestia megaterium TaxID=1404 RepID=UPI00196B0AE0|nr:metallophosphoesterase [Priestia megaterium]QSF42275.1 metallophosphoesterase [Priestia megaterium]
MNLRLLQLSDIHFHHQNYDTIRMRDELIAYLGELRKENEFNVLLITGDVANKGDEYNEEIKGFLNGVIDKINIPKTDVHLIPGNHDIERQQVRSLIIDGILGSGDPSQLLDDCDTHTYETLVGGQSKFFSFYEEFMGEAYPKEELHYLKNSNQYNIFSLNTCLLSHKPGEEGSLLIGRKKFYKAIKQFKALDNKNKVNIAIGHHTLGCINPREKDSIMSNFDDAAVDIYLCGHVHTPDYNLTANFSESIFVELTSGAVVADEYAIPGFVVVDVNVDNGDTKATYHIWNSSQDYWSVNTQGGRRMKTGTLEFNLERLKKKEIEANLESEFESDQDDGGQEIDENEFKSFIIDLHEKLSFEGVPKSSLENKIDLPKKFFNMRCTETFTKRFDVYSKDFGAIYSILESTAYVSSDKKDLIPERIIDQYLDVQENYTNGDKIFKKVVDDITAEYQDLLPYSKMSTHRYIKILAAWSIYECDIFNEDKRCVEQ